VKIIVISLTSSRERRQRIRRQFRAINTEFEFFDAVDGHGTLAHIHHFDGREFFLNTGRAAVASELACYASHLAAWRQCVDENEAFVVLEDDAKLGLSFADGLRAIEQEIYRRGFIRMAASIAGATLATETLKSFELRYCRKVPLMAPGYAISPKAARRMADRAEIVEAPIDKFIQQFWRHGQPVYALQPGIVFQHRVGEASDIGDRVRSAGTLATWLARARRKVSNATMRHWFNISRLSSTAACRCIDV
jgi:glycosyl transferase family 25